MRASSRIVRRLRVPVRQSSSCKSDTPHVCIVGGGFGGLYSALTLSSLAGNQPLKITLVDPTERFVFLPLLYELAVGEAALWEAAPRIQDLIRGSNIEFIQGSMTSASESEENGTIELLHRDGTTQQLAYDRLVVATGAQSFIPESCSGATEHAMPFYKLDDAMRLKQWLSAPDSAQVRSVCIVGGGPVGTELAATLKAAHNRTLNVALIESAQTILGTSSHSQRQAATTALRRHGVHIKLGASVSSVSADHILLSAETGFTAEKIEADLVLWTAGTHVAGEGGSGLGLPSDTDGRILTAPTLQVQGAPNVYALGDAACCRDSRGTVSDSTAQAAFQQADYVAHNLWRSLNGQQQLQYRYVPLGEMMTLGSLDGNVSAFDLLQVEGAAGGALRRAVYLSRLPTHSHRAKVALSWGVGTVAKVTGADWASSWSEQADEQLQPLADMMRSMGEPAIDALAELSRVVKPLGEVVNDVTNMVSDTRNRRSR